MRDREFGEVLLEYDERDSRVAGDAFGPFGVGEQQLWRGELEAVLDLVLGPPPVHGNGDGTERVIAQNDWIHSGVLAARMATRSP